MKTIYSLLLAAVVTTCGFAQSTFEGTIRFKMTYTGEGADQYAAFAPTGVEYKFKGSNMLATMEGGMAAMMGKILVQGDKGIAYMVKDTEQVAYKLSDDDDAATEDGTEVTVTKENETIIIQGYKCQKYKQVVKSNDTEAVVYVWATDDIKLAKPKKRSRKAKGAMMDGIEGFPLKKVTTMDLMGTKITSTEEVESITKGGVADKDFEIPSNYEIKDFDPQRMMGGSKN